MKLERANLEKKFPLYFIAFSFLVYGLLGLSLSKTAKQDFHKSQYIMF